MRKDTASLVAIMLVTSLALSGVSVAGSETRETPPEVIEIALMNEITGPLDGVAPGITAAAEIAINHINDKQSYYQFALSEYDSACDGSVSQVTAQDIVDDGIDLVAGPLCSGASIGANSVLSAAGIPHVSPTSSSPVLSDSTDFPGFLRVIPSDGLLGSSVAGALEGTGASSPAIAFADTDFVRDVKDAFIDYWGDSNLCSDSGGVVQVLEFDESTTTDFSSFADDVVDAGCDSLALFAGDASGIVEELANEGFVGNIVGWNDLDLSTISDPEDADGVLVAKPRYYPVSDGHSESERGQAFGEDCAKDSECSNGIFGSQVYDAITLLAEAYILSEMFNEGIEDSLKYVGYEWEGASYNITFNEDGDVDGGGFDICEYEYSATGSTLTLNCDYGGWAHPSFEFTPDNTLYGYDVFSPPDSACNGGSSTTPNPVRNGTILDIPESVEIYEVDPWIRWFHHIDDSPIADQEVLTYFFCIDDSLLGSTLFSQLDIYDAWFSADPDLDLYLYDPNGNLVSFSETEGDESEEVTFVADMTGSWSLDVVSYDGDGWFDLYRTVISNAAPIIDAANINTENPFINEPFVIDLCGSFDPEDGGANNLNFEWTLDGNPLIGHDGAAEQSCDFSDSFDDFDEHTFTCIVSDSFGLEATQSFTIKAVDPGWGNGDGDNSQFLDLGLVGDFGFWQMAEIWSIPNVLTSDNLSIQIGMHYEVQIQSSGGVVSTFSLDAPADSLFGHELFVESTVNGLDYDVSFKPSLVIKIWLDDEMTSLEIPMISSNQMYEGQTSFSIMGFPLLYLWDDFRPLEVDYEDGWLNFSTMQTFTLAQVDLWGVIEWMIDNIAASMGQAWVNYATNFIEWFYDIEVPLSFNVTVASAGLQVVRLNSECTCSLGKVAQVIISPYDQRYSELSPVSSIIELENQAQTEQYTVSSVITSISYVQVMVEPQINIGLVSGDDLLWQASLYEFNTETSQASGTWSSEDSTEFTWDYDQDLDGYPDVNDRFPNDHSEWEDTDDDGGGDNADVFPTDSSESIDTDGDGVGDNSDDDDDDDGYLDSEESLCGTNPKNPSSAPSDLDGDGTCLAMDAFPFDANETTDTDHDGVGDNTDAFPTDPSETTDTDGDGVGDNTDAFPTDATKATESVESDSSGVPGVGMLATICVLIVVSLVAERRDN